MNALAGEPRERNYQTTIARRVGTWLAWWVLLMSFWVMIDDSLNTDELLAGASAAAIAATVAEIVTYQAATRFRMRIKWLVPALKLPYQLARDTIIVFAALYNKLARGQDPPSAFIDLPLRYGDDTPEGATRRVLITGAVSVAPNQFVVGLDSDRDVMTVHRLVATDESDASDAGER
jgi:multisubunit Na+/H+ antiporter MnhE subunit